MEAQSFNKWVEESIRKYWDLDAMSDLGDFTYQYKDVARVIEKLHILLSKPAWRRATTSHSAAAT